MRERIRSCLGAVGVIAILLALQPFLHGQSGVTADQRMADDVLSHPGSVPFTEQYRFGWSEDPLIDYRRSGP